MKLGKMFRSVVSTVLLTLSSVCSAALDMDGWLTQAQGTTGNVTASNNSGAGWVLDGTTGFAYDYGALDQLESKPVDGATIEYVFNISNAGTSIALGRAFSWSPGSEKIVLKLEQWSDRGKFGLSTPGVGDYTFDTNSVFDEDVHVVFRRNNDSGTIDLFVNGVYQDTDPNRTNWRLDGGAGWIGAGANDNGQTDVPTGTVYGVASYDKALTDQEILDLYGATLTTPLAISDSVTIAIGETDSSITLGKVNATTFNTPVDPTNGTLVLDPSYSTNGQLTYTPNAGFVGEDSFTFTVTDGVDTSASATITVRVNGTYYVDATMADNTGAGTSWATAKKDLSAALALATADDRLFVKSGTYTLTETAVIPTALAVYGGFAGTESDPTERSKSASAYAWEFNNETTFSSNGFTTGYVVDVAGELDGVTVSGGVRGGVRINASNAIVRNCQVMNNSFAANDIRSAGGIYATSVNSWLIEGCYVFNNRAENATGYSGGVAGGIGMDCHTNAGSNYGTIRNCRVENNRATSGPGGISLGRSGSANMVVENTVVVGNTGANGSASGSEFAYAAGMSPYATSSGYTVRNCTIAANKSLATSTVGGVAYCVLSNSVVWGNFKSDNTVGEVETLGGTSANNAIQGDATATINLNAANGDVLGPNFKTPTNDAGAVEPFVVGNWQLSSGSPMVDRGDNALISLTEDLAGLDRKRSVDVATGAGVVDMGAYEYVFESPQAPTVNSSSNSELEFVCPAVIGASTTNGYIYQLDTVSTFNSPQLIDGTSGSNLINHGSLDTTTYYIRFRAQNEQGTLISDWSEVTSETVTPVIGLVITLDGAVLNWSATQEVGVASYQVEQLIKDRWVSVEELVAGAGTYESQINPEYDVRLVVVDHSGFVQTFWPDVNGKARFVYTLKEGWNLFSLPLADTDLSELLANVDGKPMVWQDNQYVMVESLKAGQAFFVYSSVATEVTITGTATNSTLKLDSGWNLSGVTENQLAPAEATIIYTLDDSYQEVLKSDILLEGVGYWIFMN